jgi:hypothetical protein
LNNYNFKLNLLIILYFFRRYLRHFWLIDGMDIHCLYPFKRGMVYLIVVIGLINIIYISLDLLSKYSIYSLMPLFYMMLLQLPMFKFDSGKRYENAPKEMIRMLKKVMYISLETCYYGIFIPVFYSMKFSPYLNMSAIFIYTIFTWLNLCFYLFGFHYYKKSAEFYFAAKTYGGWKRVKRSELDMDKLQ